MSFEATIHSLKLNLKKHNHLLFFRFLLLLRLTIFVVVRYRYMIHSLVYTSSDFLYFCLIILRTPRGPQLRHPWEYGVCYESPSRWIFVFRSESLYQIQVLNFLCHRPRGGLDYPKRELTLVSGELCIMPWAYRQPFTKAYCPL